MRMNYALAKIIDYKLWPFTEGSFTLTGAGPYQYENGFEWESAFLAIVNGTPWLGEGAGKRNFPDYMKWFSDYASDNSMIWTEYGGELVLQPECAARKSLDCTLREICADRTDPSRRTMTIRRSHSISKTALT